MTGEHELDPDAVPSLRVADLRDELRRRGLRQNGVKQELVDRLRTHLQAKIDAGVAAALSGGQGLASGQTKKVSVGDVITTPTSLALHTPLELPRQPASTLTNTPRPVTPPARDTLRPINETTRKSNSASHNRTGTDRKDIDPYLITELTGHWFINTKEGFFDHFFPIVDNPWFNSIPLPVPFPRDCSQNKVIDYFTAYQTAVQPFIGADRGEWATSPSSALRHHSNVHHNPDLYVRIAGSSDHWSTVLVVSELKNEKGLNDLNLKKVLIRLASYAREVFATQPGRSFVHGFSLVRSVMRCWVFTRAGALGSSPFNLCDDQSLPLFKRIFVHYLFRKRADLGAPNMGEITINGRCFRLEKKLFSTAAIVSRGTTCWGASEIHGLIPHPVHVVLNWTNPGQ